MHVLVRQSPIRRHTRPDTPPRLDAQEIVVGRDCWIAARAIVLPGVHIGDGSVVAAGAVVNRTCEPGSILAGVPAKVIGSRESAGDLNRERADHQG
jgi:acetyltransferase-like isoleucine patch superfamily enzyme